MDAQNYVTKPEFETAVKRLDEVRDQALRRQDEENGRQNHRIDELEKKVHDLNKIITSVEKMATHMESIDREQERQGERLEALEKRDGEMWRTIITHIITGVVGAVVAYTMLRLGF